MNQPPGETQAGPSPAPPLYLDARRELADRFLFGEGLEIGPLHQPLTLPPTARARYVDRMPIDDLRREYPELADWDLTPVDLVDDGERLATAAEGSQDFIVANHFLEHCENPIRTIETHLARLRGGGTLFYAVPDKRFTFDFRRPVTPLEHVIADYEEGPERSRRQHYDEWSRLVEAKEGQTDEECLAHARDLEAKAYSIHMHVWTQAEFMRLILHCRERFGESFDLEAGARQGIEFMVVLRKQGQMPPPNPMEHPPLPATNGLRAWRRRATRLFSDKA
ncbi:MAG TPA: methyltransferase domain-containing protein [Solirubrobacterales bacterium]